MPWTKIRPEYNEPDFYNENKGEERLLTYPEAVREGLQQALALDPETSVEVGFGARRQRKICSDSVSMLASEGFARFWAEPTPWRTHGIGIVGPSRQRTTRD